MQEGTVSMKNVRGVFIFVLAGFLSLCLGCGDEEVSLDDNGTQDIVEDVGSVSDTIQGTDTVQGDVEQGDVSGPVSCNENADCEGKVVVWSCEAAVCQNGECVTESLPFGTPCDDGEACTVGESCTAPQGLCLGGTLIECKDDEPCTSDFCDSELGCTFPPKSGDCEDGQICTVNDFCNEEGQCESGTDKSCSDGNDCTMDYCLDSVGCQYDVLDGANCDDGNP